MRTSKKLHRDFEKWAAPVIQTIQKIVLLDSFRPVKFAYSKGMESGTYMESTFLHPYKTISIKYGNDALDDFKNKDYTALKDALVHEMFHPLTDPLYGVGFKRFCTRDELNDARENLTDHLANIIRKNGLI